MKSDAFWAWYESYAAPKLATFPTMDRSGTFRQMFEHLDSFNRAINIVETGCVEEPDNWAGNGCSTLLFNHYLQSHFSGTATSIEIDPAKVAAGEKLCPRVKFICGDSVDVLAKLPRHYNRPIDLLYLDASHHDWLRETPTQVHHYKEFMAVLPLLHERTLVVVDDSVTAIDDYPQNKIVGKGGLIAQHAFEVGARMVFCKYQVGFVNMTNDAAQVDSEEEVEAMLRKARKMMEAGSFEAADRIYRLLLTVLLPTSTVRNVRVARGEAAANFGRTAHKIRRFGTAIDWFRMALENDPIASDYRCELSRSLVALGAMNAAKREAEIATEIEPTSPSVWAMLGGVASDMMDTPGTIDAYERQIDAAAQIDDPFALSDAMLNRTVIALDTREYDKVRFLCASIIALKVRAGDGYHCLAILAYRLSEHEEAIELFDKALANDCRNKPLAHWNKALPLEALGRIREAGDEKCWNEHEQTVPAIFIPQHRFNKPKWRGQHDCTVHVHTEAGFGDNISMFRYFPEMEDLGCKVIYECDPNLISLVTHNYPSITVIPRCPDYPGIVGIKPFDYHIPIGDLPHAFRTDLDSIPWRGPYLKPTPELSGEAKVRTRCLSDGLRVGLCWSSGIRANISIWMEKYGKMKSMSFADVRPLIEKKPLDTHFVSLQVGDGREEMSGDIYDFLPENPTWDETAALIANLDLVITVDTGVAHLAGAMGKPTWVIMMQDGSSWHFMCERPGASWNKKSPWYPSISVFRQHEKNSWDGVVCDVMRELRDYAMSDKNVLVDPAS